jgi:large subunit ribosomal protein L21
MKYAIIALAGQQHIVHENDEIVTQKIEQAVGEKVTVNQVMLTADGDQTQIGTPFVENASVTLEITNQGHADKIRVATYKAKSRQRKVYGHKQPLTTLKVLSIQ